MTGRQFPVGVEHLIAYRQGHGCLWHGDTPLFPVSGLDARRAEHVQLTKCGEPSPIAQVNFLDK